MDKAQVLELFKVIQSVYPRFMPEDQTEAQRKLDTWTMVMNDMDHDRVMKKVKKHVLDSKYPPTVAELAAYAPKSNNSLGKMQQWKREADQVSQETKDRFQTALKELMEEKANDS